MANNLACPICVDTVTSLVDCVFCQALACRNCIQRYLLESPSVHCMYCRKVWNREFLFAKNFSKTFINVNLKKHREDVLMDREKSLLPETQAQLEISKRGHLLRMKIVEAIKNLNSMRRNHEVEMHDRIQQFTRQLQKEYREKIDPAIDLHNSLVAELSEFESNGGDTKTVKKQFVRKCPSVNCKGFLSTRWMCGLCMIKVCPDCHEIIGKDQKDEKDAMHKCEPSILANVKSMESNTKPCPNCASLIFRVEGCDQMWCTVCKTPWNWKTGNAIVNGTIHNPHFYEWQRKGGGAGVGNVARQPGDVVCGGLPSYQDMLTVLETSALNHVDVKGPPKFVSLTDKKQGPKTFSERFGQIHRAFQEIQDMWLRRYLDQPQNYVNRRLREEYLQNYLDDVTFKRRLQQSEKRAEKLQAIHQILEMLCAAATDIFQRIIYPVTLHKTNVAGYSKAELDKFLEEFETLREYGSTQFAKVAKQYDCKTPFFDPEGWRMMDTRTHNMHQAQVARTLAQQAPTLFVAEL
jgi:hypothetical protein